MLMFSWMEDSWCATFLMPDGDLQCVYRLASQSNHRCLGMAHGCCVDKGDSNDKHHLVIESVRPDAKHARFPKLLFLLTAWEGRLSSDH